MKKEYLPENLEEINILFTDKHSSFSIEEKIYIKALYENINKLNQACFNVNLEERKIKLNISYKNIYNEEKMSLNYYLYLGEDKFSLFNNHILLSDFNKSLLPSDLLEEIMLNIKKDFNIQITKSPEIQYDYMNFCNLLSKYFKNHEIEIEPFSLFNISFREIYKGEIDLKFSINEKIIEKTLPLNISRMHIDSLIEKIKIDTLLNNESEHIDFASKKRL